MEPLPPQRTRNSAFTTSGYLSAWVIQAVGLFGMTIFGLYWMITQLAPPVFVFMGFGTLVGYGQVVGARQKLRQGREEGSDS